MNAFNNTAFNALAQGAAYCQQWGGSFVVYLDGDVHDSYDTLDDAASELADLWGEYASITVQEFAPSGRSIDVTVDAKSAVEGWCHARHHLAPWGADDSDDDESEYDFQRSVAVASGVFA